jgi:hypothetical protein
MSYLNPPRLHFAGKFQAAPSTVNNDPDHFNNATFIPDYQKFGRGTSNGWWNPMGDAVWRLVGCKVTAAWVKYDAKAADNDPINNCLIGDSDRSPPAKIVDLDPEQQMVSEIWGLQVRICLPDGTNLLRGRYDPAAFMDIWDRSAGGGGDAGGGAMYQSVLTDLEWGDVLGSPFLTTLKQSAADGLLSIKFNVDGYKMDNTSPDFTRGRIVGTIGPSSAAEPRHFVVGRHFMATAGPGGNFFAPAGRVNFCPAMVDAQAGKLVLDLGNSLPTNTPGGAISDLGTLALGYLVPGTTSSGGQAPLLLGTFNYSAPGWYETTAGLVTFPTGRMLTPDELAAIQQSPLAVTTTAANGNTTVAIAEAPNGTYVRADRFVFRLNSGDTANVRLFASQFGARYAGARIICVLDSSQLQGQVFSAIGQPPPVATPADVVEFPARVVADQNGVAELVIKVGDPKQARDFVDGQVYGVRPMLEDDLAFGTGFNFNQWDFASLLVWSSFAQENPRTWYGSIEPILQQYANLYPVMKPIVDLGDYDSVCANARILELAFGLPIDDPNSMPVTRDLSDAKRKAILRWLREPGPDGKPRKGTPPPPAAARPAAARAVAPPASEEEPIRGGKAVAASRRLMLRRR